MNSELKARKANSSQKHLPGIRVLFYSVPEPGRCARPGVESRPQGLPPSRSVNGVESPQVGVLTWRNA